MNGTLTLFYSPGACSLAPHVVLEELDIPFETVRVPVREGANLRPEYLAVNPRGRVPALRIGDEVVTENPAILLWLASAKPDAGLLPPVGSLGHARVLEWLAWLSSSLHIAFAQLWRAPRFVGADAPPSVTLPIQSHGRALIAQYFGEIDTRLAGRRFALGDDYSLVDANLLPFYRWGGLIGLDMRDDYPAWTAQAERVIARPAVRRVLEIESIEMWPEALSA